MKKQIVEEVIYSKDYSGDLHVIRFSDLPKDINDNDIISIEREGAYYSENNSYEAYTRLVIIREREETDIEYNYRISKSKEQEKELKERRYQNYLKLKSEFES